MAGRVIVQDGVATNAETATYPKFSSATSFDNNYRISSFWMENAAFLRIKNVALSYTFPKKWLSKVAVDNVKVYLNAYNPISIYNSSLREKHIDPEDWLAGSIRYPQTKLYSIGIDLTF